MTTHVVEVAVRRFYRVYVDDENDSMSEREALNKAKEMALDEANMMLDPEIDIEEHDILDAHYEYNFD